MMADVTAAQIAALRLDSRRPLVICDVDEVVVHFTRDFERYIATLGLWLDASSFALNGNVRRAAGGTAIAAAESAALIERFFADRTLHMQPIDGAVETLLGIGEQAEIVMLTNLPHQAGDDRRRNLAGHGLPYPVVTNSGPKGPAIKILAAMVEAPAVFIDDSPGFIASAHQHAPEVHLVHFLHDARFARHVEAFDFVSLRTDSWDEAGPHVLDLVNVENG
jgi:FMN phosphatase YigB (HAD superfamily)